MEKIVLHSRLDGKAELNKRLFWWPFLFGPAAVVYVYITKAVGLDALCSRYSNEIIAMPLVGVSFLIFFILACKTKNEFVIGMTFLVAAFFCREWHFAGTSTGVYIALAVFTGWFIYRREHIGRMIRGRKVKIWLFASASCYFLSQLVARRVFSERHLNLLPFEEEYHIPLEETLEAAGHILMIITSIMAWLTFYPKRNEVAGQTEP
jgi:hypothetical protein